MIPLTFQCESIVKNKEKIDKWRKKDENGFVETKLIKLYCTICQCNDSRFLEGKQRLSNNNCPKFSDEELITVYLWGKAQQLLTRKAIYNYTKSHLLDWFPALPSYQAFCRRLNRLTPAFQALAEIWTEETLAQTEDTRHYAVDSCPVMSARRSYSSHAKVGQEFCGRRRLTACRQ